MPSLESPTLESVSAEFADWRRERSTPRTPEHLQRQAVELLNAYRISEVLKALRLSYKSLKCWRQRWSESEVSLPSHRQSESFLALPVIKPAILPGLEPSQRIALKLSCQESDGKTLAIEASLNSVQWRWALELLNGPVQG